MFEALRGVLGEVRLFVTTLFKGSRTREVCIFHVKPFENLHNGGYGCPDCGGTAGMPEPAILADARNQERVQQAAPPARHDSKSREGSYIEV